MEDLRTDFYIGDAGHVPYYACELTIEMDRYDLQYIAKGEVLLEFKGKTYELKGGSSWINLPGIEYHYRPLKKGTWWDHRFIGFNGRICELWREMDLFPEEPHTISHKLDFPGRIDQVIALYTRDLLLNRFETMNIVEKLLIDLKRSAEPFDIQPEWLDDMLEELKFTNNQDVDYKGLMKKYGISRRSLFRQFKKFMGQSPHEYHLKTKINFISEKLETSNIPLKQLADLAGYKDIFYFSKQFKNLTGISPSLYRERNKYGIRKVE